MRGLTIHGRTYHRGEYVDPWRLSARLRRLLIEQRRVAIVPAADMSEDAPAGDPVARQVMEAYSAASTDDRAPEPTEKASVRIPDDWRTLHHKTRISMARTIAGDDTIRSAVEADAVIEQECFRLGIAP